MIDHDKRLWDKFWSNMVEQFSIEQHHEAFRKLFELSSEELNGTDSPDVSDMEAPKKPKRRAQTGYNLFVSQTSKDPTIKTLPQSMRMGTIGSMWRALSAVDKQPFLDRAEQLKQKNSLIHDDQAAKKVTVGNVKGVTNNIPKVRKQVRRVSKAATKILIVDNEHDAIPEIEDQSDDSDSSSEQEYEVISLDSTDMISTDDLSD